jgi:dipeptidyl aminopeptidase/acylaminoacyl peptidase
VADIGQLAHDWARYPHFWEPKVSRDGTVAAWTWTGATEAGNVWIAPTDGSKAPRRVTDESDHIHARAFSPDNRILLLAQSEGSSEHDHLILLDLGTGQQRLLTPQQDDHYIFGGAFTPDGAWVLYAASWDEEANKAIDGQCIYLHDVASGVRHIVSRAASLSDRPLELSKDGRFVLYHRHELHPGGSQVWLLDLKTGEDREILNVGDARKARGHWIDPARILVQAERDGSDQIGVLTLADLTVRWLADDDARSIEAVVAGESARAAITGYRDGVLHATEIDLDSGAERAIEAPGHSLLPIAQLPRGDWIVERYSSTAAHEIARVSPTGAMTDISRTGDHLARPGLRFTPAKSHRWLSADGTSIHGWLYEPAGESRGLIALVHGGPTWHSEDWVNDTAQFLAAAGYTVLDPNYRGSTGYGQAFREAIKLDGWGGREQVDIRTGLENLIAAGKGRKGRIGIVGLSYGGYSSWYGLTRFPDLVDAAIPICGMYQLTIDYDETGMPHGRAFSEEMMGGTPAQQPERYARASPANFIHQIRGKVMIVHGLRDTNVSPRNTEAAVRDLDRAGIPYELLTFDNEGHGIYRASNREMLYRRMAAFLETAFKF